MESNRSQPTVPSSIIRSRQVSGFMLVETLYSANANLPAHTHDKAVFCIALRGRCAEVYRSKVREYQPFTVQFLPPNETHSLDFSLAGMRAFSIDIPPQWSDRTREYALFLDNSVHSHGGLLSGLFMKLYKEFREMDSASPLAIEGLTLEMLAEVSRSQIKVSDSRPPRWLTQALDLLREQFCEHLTIAHIATSVGVHPVHLAREFRKFCRCTIGEYIRQLRIEYACRELSLSDVPLATIASAAGFSDQSHFSRTFKRLMRVTPAEYRAVFRSR